MQGFADEESLKMTELYGTVWQWPKWKPSQHVEVSSGAVAASLKQVTIDIKSNLNNITTIFQASKKTSKNESFLISQVLKVRRKGRQLTDFS